MTYRGYSGDRRGFRTSPRFDRGGRYPPRERREGQRYDPLPELPPVEFQKNFYKEAESISRMSSRDVDSFRKTNEMTVKGMDIPHPISRFEEAGFPSRIVEELEGKGFSGPTPIQAQGWPMALSGRDMVGIAQTGSGKTLSFILPGLVHAKDQQPLRRGDGPIALVLAPTRELVMQIKKVADEFCGMFGLRSTAVYGGASSQPQIKALHEGVEIVIATPGRLIDLHEQGHAPLSRVTFLVLDEADRMLDMGFEPQLRKIIPKTNGNRQTLMWSATWPREVRGLAESYMNDYIQVVVGNEELKTNSKIKQVIEVCSGREKEDKLLGVLDKFKGDKVIVFCNMKRTCDDLEYVLNRSGYGAAALHGDKSQNIRDKVLDDFRSGRRPILIATEVAGRGLDVNDVKLVINFDFPGTCEDYVHRIGRTARGNTKEGISHTFFTINDKGNARELIRMLREANQTVPSDLEDMVRVSNDRYGSRGVKHDYRGRPGRFPYRG
ncbi:DEAD box RNA helicase-like protein [Encephalitozoon intestinalis ATCC 50506]|uniref:RNA helicase n=1 Tax=Encephalitozoon intestinalis (strain ATCC 50506) TaxID=876142 RepID=E0S8S3_ENCIT|nr:DEAD box RNA helicase-like protein [Encephalitozoon intestinalis ATCC 50506]ADM12040.1 DEAD box RNA helicase-like protein [Encephalitozoon intestinalis ATCC 50506]UTX45829.1 DEAD/DEAH box helicase [Encephalitozoon intestinalis]